jgi:hypothetical protein
VKREQMNLTRSIVRTELDAGNDSYAERLRGQLCFLEAGECIVIGQRNCSESRCARCVDDCRRCKQTIGRGRMHVQVDLAGRPVGLPRFSHCL